MKIRSTCAWVVALAMYLAGLATTPTPSGATSLAARDASPRKESGVAPKTAAPTKDEIVAKYVASCLSQPVKQEDCSKIRTPAVEIVKEDLQTLGSSANRTYMPTIVKIFKNDEVELRIAAADALGMIGPQDNDTELLAPLANDPVPDVRRAVPQMISRGKGTALGLLAQRTTSMRTGLMPETPPDAGKFAMPVAPESTYLFYASDATTGRLSYVAKGGDPAAFFKGKAKKGPMKLEDFNETYRYQLQDEDHALDQAHEAASKQLENQKPPDPTNAQAMMEYLQKMQSVTTGRMTTMTRDMFQANLFGAPTVYVLEERQIGQRSYPTRYAVLYEDLALKRPGYRLAWMTVPDDAVKTAQAASLVEEKQEQARKKEDEARKKRQEALENLIQKKDEQEKQKFKKGQADLEKALGF